METYTLSGSISSVKECYLDRYFEDLYFADIGTVHRIDSKASENKDNFELCSVETWLFTVRTSVLQLQALYKILLTHGGSVADGPLNTH